MAADAELGSHVAVPGARPTLTGTGVGGRVTGHGVIRPVSLMTRRAQLGRFNVRVLGGAGGVR